MDSHEESAQSTDDGVLEESELLLELVRSIVRHPEKVKIDSAKGQTTTLLTIMVDPEDRGHVIGKEHKTLDAIIHLFVKAAYMDGGRQVLIQLDGHDPRRARSNPNRERDDRSGPPPRQQSFRSRGPRRPNGPREIP